MISSQYPTKLDTQTFFSPWRATVIGRRSKKFHCLVRMSLMDLPSPHVCFESRCVLDGFRERWNAIKRSESLLPCHHVPEKGPSPCSLLFFAYSEIQTALLQLRFVNMIFLAGIPSNENQGSWELVVKHSMYDLCSGVNPFLASINDRSCMKRSP